VHVKFKTVLLLFLWRDSVVEIPSTKTVSDDVVVTVFPVTSQHKHTFCTKLGVSKGPNARHVYEPYTLNCSLGKQPEVTLDCGGAGDCFYRCPTHHKNTFFIFGNAYIVCLCCWHLCDVPGVLVWLWQIPEVIMVFCEQLSIILWNRSGTLACHPDQVFLNSG